MNQDVSTLLLFGVGCVVVILGMLFGEPNYWPSLVRWWEGVWPSVLWTIKIIVASGFGLWVFFTFRGAWNHLVERCRQGFEKARESDERILGYIDKQSQEIQDLRKRCSGPEHELFRPRSEVKALSRIKAVQSARVVTDAIDDFVGSA